MLRLRVLFHPPVDSLPSLIERGVRSGVGSAWLRVGGVKLFLDGSLGSRTAWMLEPYAGTRDRGMPITAEAEAPGDARRRPPPASRPRSTRSATPRSAGPWT